MDFTLDGNSSSDESSSNAGESERHCHRHSAEQVQQLEAFFKDFPNPDENQRQQLSRDLGLAPRQIRFWFQNKRNQVKIQNERVSNNALREENTRIKLENLAIQEMLKNPCCPMCEGSAFIGDDVRQQNLQRLRIENAWLKQEYQRLANIVTVFRGKPGV